jgi:hypothetical protein
MILIADQKWAFRKNRKIAKQRKKTRFRVDAMPEDIDFSVLTEVIFMSS